MSRTRLLLAPVSVIVGAAALVLGFAGTAGAHVHTDPAAIEAGEPATVEFIVEHGCDGSPTTGMSMQLPDGATDIAAGEADGFTSAVNGQEVDFEGGSVPDGTEAGFPVTFTVAEPGDAVVKIVQTCEEGQLDWIEEPMADGSEPESPAPVVKVTDGPPTEADLGGGHSEGSGHEEGEEGHHGEEAADTGSAQETSATENDSDDSSPLPAILIGVGVVVIAGGVAFFLIRSRGKASEA